MSHELKMTAAEVEKEGFLVVKDSGTVQAGEILKRVCKALGLSPPKFGRHSVGEARVEGWKVKPEGWTSGVAVFNTRQGTLHIDNWSKYGPKHPDVLAGKRRVGEEGRWGSLESLDAVRREYEKQLNHYLLEQQMDVARSQGFYARVVEESPERIVLEVEA